MITMTLLQAVEKVKARADRAMTVTEMSDHTAWRLAREEARSILLGGLLGLGAVVREDWQGATMKLGGLRSGSTAGLFGAVGNWMTRAKAELEKGAVQ